MHVEYRVFLCISHKPRVFGGGCCSDKGSEVLVEKLKVLIAEYKLEDRVEIHSSSCLKNCPNGPSMVVLPGRICYGKVKSDDLKTIIEEHFIGGKPVKSLIKTPSSILG